MTLQKWISAELSILLDTEMDDFTTDYIMNMDDADQIAEYLSNLLDTDKTEVQQFVIAVVDLIINKETSEVNNSLQSKLQSLKTQQNSAPVKPQQFNEPQVSALPQRREKIKFKPLFANNTNLIPGRNECLCQASKHGLVNNCTQCGRVVCEQEGAGPCYYCSNLVCTREQEEFILTGSKKAMKLKTSLMNGVAIQKAIESRDRLVNNDRNTTTFKKIYDDQCDYFSYEKKKWLNDKDRKLLEKKEAELRDKRFASRRNKKIVVRLDGKKAEEDKPISIYNDSNEHNEEGDLIYRGPKGRSAGSDVNKPQFIVDIESASYILNQRKETGFSKMERNLKKTKPDINRIQDAHLNQGVDLGVCMSMHQPWATLLVKGIKIHEGRSWNSTHRGILWIASTAKIPTDEEMDAVLDPYRLLNIELPTSYPTGVLLGYVVIEDVICQNEYLTKFPDGESCCDYVFICTSPKELIIKHEIKGKHKIYSLPKDLHQTARLSIRE